MFTDTSSIPFRYMIAGINTITMDAILIPLFLTSFIAIRKKN